MTLLCKVNPPLEPDDKVDLWFGLDVELSLLPGQSLQTNPLLLLVGVLLDILVGPFEDDLAFGLLVLRDDAVSSSDLIPSFKAQA